MSDLRIGQRVVKARGWNVGSTGVVAEIDWSDARSLGVRLDRASLGFDERDNIIPVESGCVVFGYPDEYEPIIPSGERASDYSLSELLDHCKQGEGVPA